MLFFFTVAITVTNLALLRLQYRRRKDILVATERMNETAERMITNTARLLTETGNTTTDDKEQ